MFRKGHTNVQYQLEHADSVRLLCYAKGAKIGTFVNRHALSSVTILYFPKKGRRPTNVLSRATTISKVETLGRLFCENRFLILFFLI